MGTETTLYVITYSFQGGCPLILGATRSKKFADSVKSSKIGLRGGPACLKPLEDDASAWQGEIIIVETREY